MENKCRCLVEGCEKTLKSPWGVRVHCKSVHGVQNWNAEWDNLVLNGDQPRYGESKQDC